MQIGKSKLKKDLLFLIILICVICILLINAKSCSSRSKIGTKSGSNYNTFVINAPLNLFATAISPSEIRLDWQDNSNNENGFEIERSINGTPYESLITFGSNVISYLDSPVNLFTEYTYRVRAFNTIGDISTWSNEVSLSTDSIITWSAVAAGEFHTIALAVNPVSSSGNTLWAWGLNNAGQLGLGDASPFNVTLPAQLGSDSDWSKIAAGFNHTLSIKTNGSLWSWGANESGQLGIGNSFDNTEPVQSGTDIDWSQIAGGGNHSLGIKTNGTIWSWGYNSWGQLGLGYKGVYYDPTDPDNYVFTPAQINTASDWSAIETGGAVSFAIKTDNTLWVWGWISVDGQTTPFNVGTNWKSVSCGYEYTAGIKTDGTLWKSPRIINFVKVGNDTNWFSVTAGGNFYLAEHQLVIKTNGTLWAWGYNGYGQLGIGDYKDRTSALPIPEQVGTASDWSIVTAGGYHTIGQKNSTNTLWFWGDNRSNQLGLENTLNRNTPCPPRSPSPPSSLLATSISSTQITLTWNDNSFNEDGFKIERKINSNGAWIQIATLDKNINYYSDINESGFTLSTYYYYRIKSYNSVNDSSYSNESYTATNIWSNVSAGSNYTIACKTNNTIWSFGYNDYGQLGFGNTGAVILKPTQIGINADWISFNAGSSHVVALKSNGIPWSWGKNDYGQLGLGDTVNRSTPTQIIFISDLNSISIGGNHSIAHKTNGTIWSWGYNSTGQLGIGNSGPAANRNTPIQIGNDTDWIIIAAGNDNSFAIKTNNSLWAWGSNDMGKLGDGTMVNKLTPRQITDDTDWSLVTAGNKHTIALKTNPAGGGTAWGWGLNVYGQLGLGSTLPIALAPTQIGTDSDWLSVEAGYQHTLALKTNRTIWSWGFNGDINGYGQLGLGDTENRYTPTQIGIDSDWVTVTAGGYIYGSHSLAIKSNGTMWAWGVNELGQLGLGDSSDTEDKYTPTLVGE